jgi:hypothetical protein
MRGIFERAAASVSSRSATPAVAEPA